MQLDHVLNIVSLSYVLLPLYVFIYYVGLLSFID